MSKVETDGESLRPKDLIDVLMLFMRSFAAPAAGEVLDPDLFTTH